MKFSKNSWHYKLNRWMYDETFNNTSLCPYFWLTVLSVLITPVVFVWKTMGNTWHDRVFFMCKCIFFCFAVIVIFALLVGGILVTIFVLGMYYGLIVFVDKAKNWEEKKNKNKIPIEKSKQPSILVGYIKSKKQKICPKLEWE